MPKTMKTLIEHIGQNIEKVLLLAHDESSAPEAITKSMSMLSGHMDQLKDFPADEWRTHADAIIALSGRMEHLAQELRNTRNITKESLSSLNARLKAHKSYGNNR